MIRGFRERPEDYAQAWLSGDGYQVWSFQAPKILQALWSNQYTAWGEDGMPFDKSLPRAGFVTDKVRELYREFVSGLEINERSLNLVVAPIHSGGQKGLYGTWRMFTGSEGDFFFVVEEHRKDEGTLVIPSAYFVKGRVNEFLSFEKIRKICASNNVELGEERKKDYARVDQAINLRDFGRAYETLVDR